MEPEATSPDVRGVALLMRQGMAAWMRCAGAPCARGASRSTTITLTAARAAGCPSAMEQMLVNIVAAMALVHAKEVFA